MTARGAILRLDADRAYLLGVSGAKPVTRDKLLDYSEEELKVKVVLPWLSAHGFSADMIFVEKSFRIKLGRGVFRVNSGRLVSAESEVADSIGHASSRLDVLVRTTDGRNLLVLELKSPGHELTPEDKDQAISYARLLQGNIAPFAILTNGHEAQVYNAINAERIDGDRIPTDHEYAESGFRVSCDDIALQAQALDALISLSSDNLLAFCASQVDYRMAKLRGSDPLGAKKYIPNLYTSRKTARARLDSLLGDDNRRVILVTAPPQQGKTCFMCHEAEELLAAEQPCLFFAAIDLRAGLLNAIREDFLWTFGDASDPYQATHKLNRVLGEKEHLIILVDGLNEIEKEPLRIIDDELRRMSESVSNLTVVLSATSEPSSLVRIARDDAGNPTYLGDALPIDDMEAVYYRTDLARLHPSSSIVSLPGWSHSTEEWCTLEAAYIGAYGRDIPSGFAQASDPYLLRMAMQTNSSDVSEPKIIHIALEEKARRAGINSGHVLALLSDVASRVFTDDGPVPAGDMQTYLGTIDSPLVDRLAESGLLMPQRDRVGLPVLDFYHDRDRWYATAYLSCRWPEAMAADDEAVLAEMNRAGLSQAGIGALLWFLGLADSQRFLEAGLRNLGRSSSAPVIQTILSCVDRHDKLLENTGLLKQALDAAVRVREPGVRAEAMRLMFLTLDEDRWSSQPNDAELHWLTELANEHMSEVRLHLDDDDSCVSHYVANILEYNDYGDEATHRDGRATVVADCLCQWLGSPSERVRLRAGTALAHLAPELCLERISVLLSTKKSGTEDVSLEATLITESISALEHEWYGTADEWRGERDCPMCPSYPPIEEYDESEREQCAQSIIRMWRALTACCYSDPNHIHMFGEVHELFQSVLKDIQSACELPASPRDWFAYLSQLELPFE